LVSIKLKIVILIIGLIIVSVGEAYGMDWKFYWFDENFLAYYDAQSITRPSKNIVRMWVKLNYNEKGVMDVVGKLGKKYENFSHVIVLYEINCIEKMIRAKESIDYDNKGRVIHSSRSPLEWNFIIPGSMGEILYEIFK
jgi:hypothetical protein